MSGTDGSTDSLTGGLTDGLTNCLTDGLPAGLSYQQAFEACPIGLAQADPATGRVLRVNRELARMLGHEPQHLVGRSFLAFTHPDDRAHNWESFQRLSGGEVAELRLEKRLLRRQGEPIWVLITVTLTHDEQGRPIATSAAVMDITDRRQVEDALAESEQRLQLALDAAELGRWEWDPGDDRVHADARTRALLGLDADEPLRGLGALLRHVHADDIEQVWACDAAGRSGEAFHGELRVLPRTGEERWLRIDAQGEAPADGRPGLVIGVVADTSLRRRAEEALRRGQEVLENLVQERTERLLTANTALANQVEERRAAEQQVRELLGQMVSVAEEERRHISRELHDTIGQFLTALTVGLHMAVTAKDLPEPVRAQLAQLQQAARQLDDDVDRLSHRLRPTALDDLGLEDALRQLTRRWSEETGIELCLHTSGLRTGTASPVLDITVFRFVQEALTNVRRHAAATQVTVIVERGSAELRAIVEDDGQGFDPDDAARRDRLGLRGMAERAALAGGRLEVESTPGRGATVFLVLPMRALQPDQ